MIWVIFTDFWWFLVIFSVSIRRLWISIRYQFGITNYNSVEWTINSAYWIIFSVTLIIFSVSFRRTILSIRYQFVKRVINSERNFINSVIFPKLLSFGTVFSRKISRILRNFSETLIDNAYQFGINSVVFPKLSETLRKNIWSQWIIFG